MDRHDLNKLVFEVWDSDVCIAQADKLAVFLEPLFEPDDWSDYAGKLRRRARLSAIVALDESGALAGLKMGSERSLDVFNTFIGAVAPAYRGLGLASILMDRQHKWAKEAGFRGLETATRQDNQKMQIINLKSGFVVAGIDIVPGTFTKVLFYKDLRPQLT